MSGDEDKLVKTWFGKVSSVWIGKPWWWYVLAFVIFCLCRALIGFVTGAGEYSKPIRKTETELFLDSMKKRHEEQRQYLESMKKEYERYR